VIHDSFRFLLVVSKDVMNSCNRDTLASVVLGGGIIYNVSARYVVLLLNNVKRISLQFE